MAKDWDGTIEAPKTEVKTEEPKTEVKTEEPKKEEKEEKTETEAEPFDPKKYAAAGNAQARKAFTEKYGENGELYSKGFDDKPNTVPRSDSVGIAPELYSKEAGGTKENAPPSKPPSTPPSTPAAGSGEKEQVVEKAQKAATKEDGSFDVDMFLDALFTGLQNVGGTLLNVGAAYTGGNPGFKTDRKSLWRERLEGKNKAITSSLMNAVKGSDSNMQYQQLEQALKSMGYQNASEARRQEIAKQVMKEYASAIKNGSVTNVEVENLINILNTTDTQGQLSPITNALMSLF